MYTGGRAYGHGDDALNYFDRIAQADQVTV
jgi:hypothetical protein